MAAIDVGTVIYAAGSSLENYCLINPDNPANATGTITEIDIWVTAQNRQWRVGTCFNVGGVNFTTRDSELITVAVGANNNIPVDLDVVVGDLVFIDFLAINNRVNREVIGGSGYWWAAAGVAPFINQAFTLSAGRILPLYGTGKTVGGRGWAQK